MPQCVISADINVRGDEGKRISIDNCLATIYSDHMLRRNTPEDINSRLNREMWRMRLGGWTGFIGVVIIFAVVCSALVRVPEETAFKTGVVTGTMAHMTEDHPVVQIGVLVNGENRSATTRAMLLHPANGETICLRETTYWPFGQVTLNMTDPRFCK